jgi:AbrB family looped-hinge helix DNA binding protein
MAYTMKSTIDSAGRLVIPKAIRRAVGLTPNMALEVRCHDGVIEIEPAPSPVVFERQGRFVIAAPVSPCGYADQRNGGADSSACSPR